MSGPEEETKTALDEGKEKAPENEDVKDAPHGSPGIEAVDDRATSKPGTEATAPEEPAPPSGKAPEVSAEPSPAAEEKAPEDPAPPSEKEAEVSAEPSPAAEEKSLEDPASPSEKAPEVSAEPSPAAEEKSLEDPASPSEKEAEVSAEPSPAAEEKSLEDPASPSEKEAEVSAEPSPAAEEKPPEDPAPPVEGEEGDDRKEEVPAPVLRPISEILSDNEGVFDIVETRVHTREEAVGLLVEKHERFIKVYSEELERGVSVDPSVIEALETARMKRDELNVKVRELKERRTSLKSKNKQLRMEFLDLVRIQESIKDRLPEINSLNDFIDREEYKLETEGVDLENERRLMRSIKEAMDKVREVTGGSLPGEMDEKLVRISDEMRENFEKIENAHQELVGLAEESQVHHNSFVEENKKVKEAESRKRFLGLRIKLHEEMAKFWENQTGNAAAMEASDKERNVEDIRDSILKAIEEADKQAPRGPGEKGHATTSEDGSGDAAGEGQSSPEPPAGGDPEPVKDGGPEGDGPEVSS
ncbi:MAG: hypothetical protein QCI82_09705 [Candidatus Thermoplasmatota archaeon]|nr:hypothetical protein [Candidatus Thermoplasmatota archaeon]